MKLSRVLTNFVCESRNMDDDERSIIQFGISILLTKLINLFTELIIGCLFSMVLQTVLFLFVFTFLRSYAGGFHAPTAIKCYVFSTFTMIISLMLIKYTYGNFNMNYILFFAGTVICVAFSPVEAKNKLLDDIEVAVYRKKVIIIIFIIILAFITAAFFKCKMITDTLSIVMFIESLMLILGKVF